MTGLLMIKLLRDLRVSWQRMLLMVLALAVSLTAFGAVLFAWTAGGRETGAAYAGTEPASATILLDRPVDADTMAGIVSTTRTVPGVLEATGRTQFNTDIEVNGHQRDIPLQVFAATAADPMRMANFSIRQRTWPPSAGEVFIGRDSLALLDVAVGDTVSIETPTAGRVNLLVADTVYDPSLSPSPQEQTGRAYLSVSSLAASGRTPVLDQLKIQVAEPGGSAPSHDRDAVVAVATDVGQGLQREYGLAIREIQVPEPYAHPHQWQADALLLSLLAGGVATLVLSTVLVAVMLDNVFTRQIPQIGIMKAVGARSRTIWSLYLVMTLLTAAAATLLAFAPAVLLGRVAVGNFLGFLGVYPSSLAPPWWTYLVLLAVGLGLPPLMALPPLIKAGRITVRAAIDHHGGSSKPSSASAAVAWLSRVRRLDRGRLMALRNTVRRPARSLLSVGLLTCAGMVFVAGTSLGTGVEAIEAQQKAQRTWDVDVQLANPAAAEQIAAATAAMPGISRIEGFAVVPTGVAGPGRIPLTRTYPDQGHGRISVTAIPDDATTIRPPTLLEGRWMDPAETGAVVLNQLARKNTIPDLHAGDTVQLLLGGRPTTWRVVGIAQETGHGSAVYTTAEGLALATGAPRQVNQLRIVTTSHDEHARDAVADAVGEALADAGVEVKSASSIRRSEAIGSGHLGPVILILLGIALPLGVIGLIGIAATMSANVLDRTREFGIMHAIGARPSSVRRIVVAEGLLLAATSCLAAVVPTLALTAALGAGLGDLFFAAPLPYRISLPAVGVWLALVVLGSALATDAAATRASHITVRDAITAS